VKHNTDVFNIQPLEQTLVVACGDCLISEIRQVCTAIVNLLILEFFLITTQHRVFYVDIFRGYTAALAVPTMLHTSRSKKVT